MAFLALCACSDQKPSDAKSVRLTDAEAKTFLNVHSCNGCHATDEMRIGPPFRAVAQMYDGASEATIDQLALKIRNGGAGSWGTVPMVARPELSDGEAKQIARWIVSIPLDQTAHQKSDAQEKPGGIGQ